MANPPLPAFCNKFPLIRWAFYYATENETETANDAAAQPEPEHEPEPEPELEAMSEEPDPLHRCDTKCRNVPHVGFVFMVKVELRLGRPIKAAHLICVCVCVVAAL